MRINTNEFLLMSFVTMSPNVLNAKNKQNRAKKCAAKKKSFCIYHELTKFN